MILAEIEFRGKQFSREHIKKWKEVGVAKANSMQNIVFYRTLYFDHVLHNCC